MTGKSITALERPKYHYPANECKFIVSIEVTHEAGHNIRLKFNWFQNCVDKLEFTEIDTGPLKEWSLIKVDGEDLPEAMDSRMNA